MFADSAYVQEMESSSSYFFHQDPKLLFSSYGENQQRYREFSNEVVDDLIQDLQFAKAWNHYDKILSEILSPLGKLRRKIALELGTIEAEDFGRLRPANISSVTILGGSLYNAAANACINSLVQALFRILQKPFFSFEEMLAETVPAVKYRLLEDKLSLTDTSIILRTSSEIENIAKTISETKSPIVSNGNMLHVLFSDINSQGTWIPLNHKQWALILNAIEYYKKEIPPLPNTKSLYYQIETSLTASSLILSEVLLRFDVDLSTNRIIEVQPPLILHMNSDFIETMIQNMDRDIENLLNLDPLTPIEKIIDLIGAIRYKFAHAMPYIRGSAAIAEWIETALYRYMGFQNFRQSAITTIDLEAFSSLSFTEFLTRYRSIIDPLKLIRIHTSIETQKEQLEEI